MTLPDLRISSPTLPGEGQQPGSAQRLAAAAQARRLGPSLSRLGSLGRARAAVVEAGRATHGEKDVSHWLTGPVELPRVRGWHELGALTQYSSATRGELIVLRNQRI